MPECAAVLIPNKCGTGEGCFVHPFKLSQAVEGERSGQSGWTPVRHYEAASAWLAVQRPKMTGQKFYR